MDWSANKKSAMRTCAVVASAESRIFLTFRLLHCGHDMESLPRIVAPPAAQGLDQGNSHTRRGIPPSADGAGTVSSSSPKRTRSSNRGRHHAEHRMWWWRSLRTRAGAPVVIHGSSLPDRLSSWLSDPRRSAFPKRLDRAGPPPGWERTRDRRPPTRPGRHASER